MSVFHSEWLKRLWVQKRWQKHFKEIPAVFDRPVAERNDAALWPSTVLVALLATSRPRHAGRENLYIRLENKHCLLQLKSHATRFYQKMSQRTAHG